jgi:integrase
MVHDISSRKGKKGIVQVREDSGSVKACFPRSFFEHGKQIKLATGINLSSADWEAQASRLQRRLQLELEEGKLSKPDGTFNLDRYQDVLEEYGLRAKLRIVRQSDSLPESQDSSPPTPKMGLLEVWDIYCEYKKPSLRESVYEGTYQGTYKNFIQSAIQATKSEDAIKIRNWLVKNRNLVTTKQVLSELSKAHQLLMRQNNSDIKHNPYDGLAEEIQTLGAKGQKLDEVKIDDDALDKSKAYTWDEVLIILEYVKNTRTVTYWHNFIKFKFLTGCRTGEAVALMWQDVDWEKERILIRRSYDRGTKKFYPLKNDSSYKGELVRRFPMPKDGELWKLLKSIEQGQDNEVVFKNKSGRIIDPVVFQSTWSGRQNSRNKGIIPTLIKQGKLTKYLSAYHTRHTFIYHAIFDLGHDEKVVSKWCGHTVGVSAKHYQDVELASVGINPEIPISQQGKAKSELEQFKEDWIKEREEFMRQIEAMKKQLEQQQQ